MGIYRVRQWKTQRALVVIATTLALGSLAGCGGMGQSLTVPQDVVTPTTIPSETPSVTPVGPTPTLNSKELFLVHEQETSAAIRTEVALTAAPTWTPGPPPPGPSATPRLGLFSACASRSSRDPQIVTCWVGVLNGQIVDVDTGSEGLDGDPDQGIVIVYTRGTRDTQLFETPDKVGPVQITSIDGTRFTLTTVNHQPPITYIFDIAARQWVNP